MTSRHFKSFSTVVTEIQAQRNLPTENSSQQCEAIWGKYRDSQEILYFETVERILGPGRLISFDFNAALVRLQLLGDNEIVELPFDKINDFGTAKYNAPENMGETLLGAFWEAKVTRKYLERIVANSYARLSPEEIDSFQNVARVGEDEIAGLCPLDLEEAEIKKHLCDIIGNPFAQKDWGGKVCDIFCGCSWIGNCVASSLRPKGQVLRTTSSSDFGFGKEQAINSFACSRYLLKSLSYKAMVRLTGRCIAKFTAQVAEKLMTNQPVYYLVMDGVQTARLLRAFNKI